MSNDLVVNKGENGVRSVPAEIESFTRSLDVSPVTVESYRRKVGAFLQWAKDHNVVEPTAADILEYKRDLTARGLSPYTVSVYLSAVRRFFAWAETEGIYPNVAREIRGAKTRRQFNKDALTADQARKVIQAAGSPREAALVVLLLTTGMRSVEVIRADVGDLRTVGDKTVLYVHGKGRESKDDFVVVPPRTVEALHAYLATRGPLKDTAPLFAGDGNRSRGRLTTRTVRRIVTAIFRRAGLSSPKLSTHSTRHTAVTLALQAGASIQEAQHLARHANINTTMIYSHNLDRLGAGTETKVADAIFA